jgi:hypothetical protein
MELVKLANKALDICDVRFGKWNPADFAKVFGDLVIKECANICEDADQYRVPASEYAGLVRKFKRLDEADYVVRIG